MPLNAVVGLPDSDRVELARWLRAPSMPAGLDAYSSVLGVSVSAQTPTPLG